MYVNPFVAGIICTILAEIAILFTAYGITHRKTK
jgi:hypothetical protein